MASELIDLIENTTGRVKAAERKSFNLDGRTPSQAAAAFRSRFKDRIFTAVATGLGRQLFSAGFPFERRS
jgi:hypothetical protein